MNVAAEILQRRRPNADVKLTIQAGIGEEGDRIEGENPVRITGNDERGLLYGVGRVSPPAGLARDIGAGVSRARDVFCLSQQFLPQRATG